MKKDLYIIGAGGLGREMLATFRNCEFDKNYDHLFFIDSKQGTVDGIEIIGNNEYLISLNSHVDVIIALSNINVRQKLIKEMSDLDFLNFITFIHPRASIYDKNITIGKGCFIAENCVLSTNIKIGSFSLLNVSVSLHHDTQIGENCVLMPGVRITGGATIGSNSFLGTNYCIADNRTIEENSILNL